MMAGSKAHFFGYKLFSQTLPKSEDQQAQGWRAGVIGPDNQPVIVEDMAGPFISRTEAELFAEGVARSMPRTEVSSYLLAVRPLGSMNQISER